MSDQEHDADPRPKPKYGELAPEGWTWSPPEDQSRLDTSRGSETAEPDEEPTGDAYPGGPRDHEGLPQHPVTGLPYGPGAPTGTTGPYPGHPYAGHPVAPGAKPAPYWNQPITLVLILIGLVGALLSISTLGSVPLSMQALYTSEKLGTYHPPADLSAIILAGQILQGILWAVSLVISLMLMARGRLSFYVPLIAGVAAAIALMTFVVVIIATDPSLMSAYGNP